jgi:vacuolar-type H+-ATPase subunit E/Vma4
MALQHILEAIAAEAEAEATAILRRVEVEAAEQRAAAEQQAAARRQQLLAAAEAQAAQERSRLLHRAHLDTIRRLVEVQEQAFLAALAAAKTELARLRRQPEYAAVFAALLREALAVSDELTVVRVDPRDAELAAALVGATHTIEPTLTTWGGVIALSRDGRVMVENTLESRLERALPDLRALLAPLLGVETTSAVPTR